MCHGKRKKKREKKKSNKPFWWTPSSSRRSSEEALNQEESFKHEEQGSTQAANELMHTSMAADQEQSVVPTETALFATSATPKPTEPSTQQKQTDQTQKITAKIQQLNENHLQNPKPIGKASPDTSHTTRTKVSRRRRKSAIENTETSVNKAGTDKRYKDVAEKLTKVQKTKHLLHKSDSLKDLVEKLLQQKKQTRELAKKSIELRRSTEDMSKSKSRTKSARDTGSSSPIGDAILPPTARRPSTKTRESLRPPSVRMVSPAEQTVPVLPTTAAPTQPSNEPTPIQQQSKQIQAKPDKAGKDKLEVTKKKQDEQKKGGKDADKRQ